MQARSLVGTAAWLERCAEATLELPVVTSAETGHNGWDAVDAVRELGELLRSSAPIPYERGTEPAVDETVAAVLADIDAGSLPSADDDGSSAYGPGLERALERRRVVRVGDAFVVPLSDRAPGVHNWPVVLEALDGRLETAAETFQRVGTRLERAAGTRHHDIWTTALEMLESTRLSLQYLWRRRQTLGHAIDGADDDGEPRRFGRWALEHMRQTDDA